MASSAEPKRPAPPFSTPAARWLALTTRDPAASSAFIYAVKTTKIYCRPTCPSRLARRANIVFYASPAAAHAAGYRACKRCKPDAARWDAGEKQREMVRWACGVIEGFEGDTDGGGGGGVGELLGSGSNARDGKRVDVGKGGEAKVSLAQLAGGAGRTKSHFHRTFRRLMGVTPKGYGEVVRALRETTQESPLVDVDSGSTSACGEEISTPVNEMVDGDGWMWNAGLEMDGWDEGVVMKTGFGLGDDFDPTSKSCELIQRSITDFIEYTIQPWSSSLVLIAATTTGICHLDTGDSSAELLTGLRMRFPFAEIALSEWCWSVEGAGLGDGVAVCDMFAAVMEALVMPSGKMVDVVFDVPV